MVKLEELGKMVKEGNVVKGEVEVEVEVEVGVGVRVGVGVGDDIEFKVDLLVAIKLFNGELAGEPGIHWAYHMSCVAQYDPGTQHFGPL